jgi:TRAP-type C4-dicarboxylate transport system substrate-binding protein
MKNQKLAAFILMGVMVVVMILGGAYAKQAAAQVKPVVLKYSDLFNPKTPYGVSAVEWIAKIEKETGGQVHIEPYWGATLLSPTGAYSELSRGVSDIGLVATPYIAGGFPLYIFQSSLCWDAPSVERTLALFYDLWKKFPELRAECDKVKFLAPVGITTHQLLTTKPIRSLQDLKGLRIKVAAYYIPVFKALGAEPVSMSMADVYIALQKGTLGGAMSPFEALLTMKFAEVAKYATTLNLRNGSSSFFGMNWDSWNKLSPDVKKVFDSNNQWLALNNAKGWEDNDKRGINFGKQQGVEFIQLPPADLAKFFDAVKAEAVKTAAGLDAKGLPGSKFLNEARTFIEAKE